MENSKSLLKSPTFICALIVVVLTYMASLPLAAQQVAPQVLGSAGSVGSLANSYSLSWTVGEPFVKSEALNSYSITEGFQQPEWLVSSTNQVLTTRWKGMLYPNPTEKTATLHIEAGHFTKWEAKAYAANGKWLANAEAAAENPSFSFDLEKMPCGTYFIIVSDGMNQMPFKLIKQ